MAAAMGGMTQAAVSSPNRAVEFSKMSRQRTAQRRARQAIPMAIRMSATGGVVIRIQVGMKSHGMLGHRTHSPRKSVATWLGRWDSVGPSAMPSGSRHSSGQAA